MRNTYGLLVYMLMDSCEREVQDLLEFKCVRPLHTVYAFLEARGGLKVLDDPLMHAATAEIKVRGRTEFFCIGGSLASPGLKSLLLSSIT
jgi:hypothetical protein